MKNSGYDLLFVREENGMKIPVFINKDRICESAISIAM
jgi:hypothetical protein